MTPVQLLYYKVYSKDGDVITKGAPFSSPLQTVAIDMEIPGGNVALIPQQYINITTILAIRFRAVFNCSIRCKMKTDQSQRTQTVHRTNQSSKQIHVIHLSDAKRGKTRASRVTIGIVFTSDWTKKWREFFKPITYRSNEKSKQTRITFNSQV